MSGAQRMITASLVARAASRRLVEDVGSGWPRPLWRSTVASPRACSAVPAEMQARFHGRDPAKAMADRLALVRAGRFGQPAEIADLVCYLASDQAGFLTGLSIPFDGGQLRATL